MKIKLTRERRAYSSVSECKTSDVRLDLTSGLGSMGMSVGTHSLASRDGSDLRKTMVSDYLSLTNVNQFFVFRVLASPLVAGEPFVFRRVTNFSPEDKFL